MNLLKFLKPSTANVLNQKNIRDFDMNISNDEQIILDFLSNIDKEFKDETGKNDSINQGKYFEKFLLALFNSAGYNTTITDKEYSKRGIKYTGDRNVDLIAKKDKEIIAIQAKHYRMNTKKPKLINKDFINKYSGITDHGFTNKMFITTTLLNPYSYLELEENEKTKNIEWIDRIGLFNLINTLNPTIFLKQNFQNSLPDTIKKCTKCENGYLIQKYANHNYFLACHNYPECAHTEKLEIL
ncbi:hypothetical protein FACS1894192_00560 [Bacilli bacterium]|nr:hypothetical protein FACS1894192_00560 [Bacilli bacterium]